MKSTHTLRKGFLTLIGLLLSTSLWAHGGAKGTDTDQCKFELEPDHWIHYTAYQPNAFPAEEFCANIPRDKEALILVFDCQDQKYKTIPLSLKSPKNPKALEYFTKSLKNINQALWYWIYRKA